MPLFKGCGCKGKPAKAIDYITDEKKAAILTSYALDDNRDYARQFAETAKLFGKAQKYDSRKYYHFKHSFDPKDNISPKACSLPHYREQRIVCQRKNAALQQGRVW